MQKLLDRIEISQNARRDYMEFAHDIAQMLTNKDINPDDIRDENAFVAKDGSLEIFLMICGVRYSMRIEACDWKQALANG